MSLLIPLTCDLLLMIVVHTDLQFNIYLLWCLHCYAIDNDVCFCKSFTSNSWEKVTSCLRSKVPRILSRHSCIHMSGCTFLGDYLKWKWPVQYLLDPRNVLIYLPVSPDCLKAPRSWEVRFRFHRSTLVLRLRIRIHLLYLSRASELGILFTSQRQWVES